MTLRACLIVDNPLRDLDGIALIAWHIARAGGQAYLVPMYTQGFDVPALAPDVVLTNYVRRNNADLLKHYRGSGMAVVVLDTEGAVGKSADDNANLVASMKCGGYIDAYCFWGEQQRDAFRAKEALPVSVMRSTGCPRYDFCAPAWRRALPQPAGGSGYVLINTNFPIVHPRYSRDTDTELAVWIAAGIDPAWARQFAADARLAHAEVIETVRRLAARFPQQRFVLRPHPFERDSAYDALRAVSNCEVRQEGTSLEWLNAARLLLHQNCSTAIEAAMLGVAPISLEWFNTEALRLAGPTSVSHLAPSYAALEEMVGRHLAGEPLTPAAAQQQALDGIVREHYLSNDGASAERVAKVLKEAADTRSRRKVRVRPSARGRVVHTARALLGYRGFERLRRAVIGREAEARRHAKYFSVEQVTQVIGRIDAAARAPQPTRVSEAQDASGRVVQVSA